jgi:uncharacterized membrane protein YhhN
MKSKIVLLIVLLFAILGIEIYAENTQNLTLLYSTKPLLMPILLVMMFSETKPLQTKFGRLIVLGLIFSLLGDVLLMIRELDLFIPGLLSFLTAQILYSIAFLSQRNYSHSKSFFVSVLLGFTLFYIAFMLFIQSQIFKLDDAAVLAPAVFIYGAVICLMGISAALRKGQVSSKSFNFIFLGALFFITSDAILATSKFTDIALPYPNFLVMSTYVLAQLGIVLGAVEATGS